MLNTDTPTISSISNGTPTGTPTGASAGAPVGTPLRATVKQDSYDSIEIKKQLLDVMIAKANDQDGQIKSFQFKPNEKRRLNNELSLTLSSFTKVQLENLLDNFLLSKQGLEPDSHFLQLEGRLHDNIRSTLCLGDTNINPDTDTYWWIEHIYKHFTHIPIPTSQAQATYKCQTLVCLRFIVMSDGQVRLAAEGDPRDSTHIGGGIPGHFEMAVSTTMQAENQCIAAGNIGFRVKHKLTMKKSLGENNSINIDFICNKIDDYELVYVSNKSGHAKPEVDTLGLLMSLIAHSDAIRFADWVRVHALVVKHSVNGERLLVTHDIDYTRSELQVFATTLYNPLQMNCYMTFKRGDIFKPQAASRAEAAGAAGAVSLQLPRRGLPFIGSWLRQSQSPQRLDTSQLQFSHFNPLTELDEQPGRQARAAARSLLHTTWSYAAPAQQSNGEQPLGSLSLAPALSSRGMLPLKRGRSSSISSDENRDFAASAASQQQSSIKPVLHLGAGLATTVQSVVKEPENAALQPPLAKR